MKKECSVPEGADVCSTTPPPLPLLSLPMVIVGVPQLLRGGACSVLPTDCDIKDSSSDIINPHHTTLLSSRPTLKHNNTDAHTISVLSCTRLFINI